MTTKKTIKKKGIGGVLSSAKAWIKYVLAADKGNRVVSYDDRRAVRWCLVGAAAKVHPLDSSEFYESLSKMTKVIETNKKWKSRVLFGCSLWNICATFNNHPKTTFADIETLIKKAGV